MPYEGQAADKASHGDIITNPHVRAFLLGCEYARVPSEEEGKKFRQEFLEVMPPQTLMPDTLVAIDGSPNEARIHQHMLPSTSIGYAKISAFYLDLTHLAGVRIPGTELIDPFKMAKLRDQAVAHILMLPGPNVRYKGAPTVRDGFRSALDEQLGGPTCRFMVGERSTSLRAALFKLYEHHPDGTKIPSGTLFLEQCPNPGCTATNIQVHDTDAPQQCPGCKRPVYPSDYLRIWEAVSESGPIGEALGRVMNVTEHLSFVAFMEFLRTHAGIEALRNLAVLVDGPLAIMGNAARLHRRLMAYLFDLNATLVSAGHPELVVIGLQKTGMLVEHLESIARFLDLGTIRVVDDEYRDRHIAPVTALPGNTYGHGKDTHYGQDFLFKTSKAGQFIFALPYPFRSKAGAEKDFGKEFKMLKGEIDRYGQRLWRACALIERLETSVYPNALIPISLAHQYTAISVVPGGKVLRILSERALATNGGSSKITS